MSIAKFTITNGKEFLTELKLMQSVVNKKTSIPVLQCVKLDVLDGILTITGTDLDNTLFSKLPAQI